MDTTSELVQSEEKESVYNPQSPGLWTYIAFVLANLGLCIVYGGVLQVLLATQANNIAGANNRVGQLAIVTSVGALSSMIAQPVAGWIADKTNPKFGKRKLWILLGGILSFVFLLPVAWSSSIWMLTLTWAVCMWPLNTIQVNLSAFIPERTPLNRRGLMSGIMGVARYGGMTVGVIIVGKVNSVTISYIVIGVICALAAVLYAFTTKDLTAEQRQEWSSASDAQQPKAAEKSSGKSRDVLFTSAAHDFWLAFASRFCVIGSYFLVTGYMLYMLQDYIHYGNGTLKAATAGMAVVTTVITIGNLVCSVLGGLMSDSLGKLKMFVIAAALLFVIPALVMFFVHSWPALLVSCAFIGIGFGTYNAVDQALVARVLPSKDTAARDLGIINFADAGPQTVAPTIAAAIVSLTHNYGVIFLAMGVFCAIGAIIATRIRSVS
ncbi:MFS transporter [Bifidobacterium sp. ESL0732]|uniref:MFS transporter n=1 Tax=Bifidobacterium sp. ESL0732 TaxID=2983222 RepID=UPI0023F647A6|nr:MFS transporter [Bifidobacterium sp. ESL0732]WEV63992.1 MFS transporter [Bifidobacterium sp. ESL0732]